MKMRLLLISAYVVCAIVLAVPLSGGAESVTDSGPAAAFEPASEPIGGRLNARISGRGAAPAQEPYPEATETATPGGPTNTPSGKVTSTPTATNTTEGPTQTSEPSATSAVPTSTEWGPYPYPQPTGTNTRVPVYVDMFLPLLFKGEGTVEPTATPTLSPTTGPSPTPSATHAPCTSDLIMNGSFEFSGYWTMPYTAYSAGYSSSAAHTDTWSMRLGIADSWHNTLSYSTASQGVYIPWDATSVDLSFWAYKWSGEAGVVPTPYPRTQAKLDAYLSYDVQYVLIMDSSDNWIDTLMWTADNTQGWYQYSYDLSKYAGRSIRVLFGAYNNGSSGVTGMYVDDVSLDVTASSLCP